MKASVKTAGATLVFSAAGISGLLFVSDWRNALPLIVFYAMLVWNTHFSIRLFSRIQPRGGDQYAIDALLFVLYLLLAASFSSETRFIFWGLLLFVFATAKYALMLGRINHPKLLKRKLLADLSGTALAALTLGGALAGYRNASAWALCIAFVLANILLSTAYPLYRPDTPIETS